MPALTIEQRERLQGPGVRIDELGEGKLSEDTLAGRRLQQLFGRASEHGEFRMDRILEKINQRLEPYGRELKLTREGDRRPADYELTLYDSASGDSLGSVDIKGRGRK